METMEVPLCGIATATPEKQCRKPILTKDVLAGIPALVEQGMKSSDIAAQLGCTPATLQVQCSRAGISLRKGGRKPTLALPDRTPLTLSRRVLIALREYATTCGSDEAKLASRLLEVIVRDNLFDAVLDDKPGRRCPEPRP